MNYTHTAHIDSILYILARSTHVCNALCAFPLQCTYICGVYTCKIHTVISALHMCILHVCLTCTRTAHIDSTLYTHYITYTLHYIHTTLYTHYITYTFCLHPLTMQNTCFYIYIHIHIYIRNYYHNYVYIYIYMYSKYLQTILK